MHTFLSTGASCLRDSAAACLVLALRFLPILSIRGLLNPIDAWQKARGVRLQAKIMKALTSSGDSIVGCLLGLLALCITGLFDVRYQLLEFLRWRSCTSNEDGRSRHKPNLSQISSQGSVRLLCFQIDASWYVAVFVSHREGDPYFLSLRTSDLLDQCCTRCP